MKRWIPWLLLVAGTAPAAEQEVDPTFIRRSLAAVAEARVRITSASAHYRPLFGEGDPDRRTLRGVTRFGELQVDANGHSARVSYTREENMLLILSGSGSVSYGGRPVPVRTGDYVYLPAGLTFGLDGGTAGIRAVLMGYTIPDAMPLKTPATIMMANLNDVALRTVGVHPSSTQYRLLMGDTGSTRDKLATGHLMTSLFIMEMAPGGTNLPHHHEHQEEIYLLLDGSGDMVAGGGSDGIMGRFRARAGDAYYYRPNTTVGFYNDVNGKPARILAVRNNLPPEQ